VYADAAKIIIIHILFLLQNAWPSLSNPYISTSDSMCKYRDPTQIRFSGSLIYLMNECSMATYGMPELKVIQRTEHPFNTYLKFN